MKLLALFTFCAFLITACTSTTPDQSTIETAVTQTIPAASPTRTQTIAPTNTATDTITPTFTPSPSTTPTETPTITATPDLRVIAVEPKDLLLTVKDLPEDAKYTIPYSNWISPHRNSEIFTNWARELGKQYLEETGRIDGWWVFFLRNSTLVRAPEKLYHNIIQDQTHAGAQLTVRKYNYIDSGRFDGWEFFDSHPDIGDVSLAMIWKQLQPDGKYKIEIRIETAYRNYASIVSGYGWEEDVSLEYMIDIANLALAKLEAAPLVEKIEPP